MIRILEILVSLLIVLVLGVVIGVLLPSHGHVERSVVVSSPLRQAYDTVNTFRRFPQWAAVRGLDPQVQIKLDGVESGPGAKVSWSSALPRVGNGSYEISKSDQDSKIEMKVDNNWTGENKTFAIGFEPSQNGRTVKINWSFDADYGWNLISRYAGLYIYGDPAQTIQSDLNNIAAMLAGFPNTDYKDQKIDIADVTAKPVFLVATKAKRSLDEVADATSTALTEIDAALKKAGLTQAGPRMTITTNWGEEDYAFSIAVPVSAATFTLDKHDYTIETPVPAASDTDSGEDDGQPKTYNAGDKDHAGMLVVGGNVRAALWYQGKALVTEYTGSPAALPLLRLNQKAYAETHGYRYAEAGLGRFWDELTSAPDAPEDQETFKVYLPIQQ
ncbi:MAG: hypothetical protein ABW187_08375 [Dokdonella sp.]